MVGKKFGFSETLDLTSNINAPLSNFRTNYGKRVKTFGSGREACVEFECWSLLNLCKQTFVG